MVFPRVVVRTVDHDGTDNTLTCNDSFRASHMLSFIISFSAPASQDDMTVWVSCRLDNGREPIGIDAEKMVRLFRGDHRVPCNFKVAFCAVLEADGHRQPAGHFPVWLAFGGAGADCDPTPEIGN